MDDESGESMEPVERKKYFFLNSMGISFHRLSRFDTIPACGRLTDRHTRTRDDSIYSANRAHAAIGVGEQTSGYVRNNNVRKGSREQMFSDTEGRDGTEIVYYERYLATLRLEERFIKV